jgi:hypothetical protein
MLAELKGGHHVGKGATHAATVRPLPAVQVQETNILRLAPKLFAATKRAVR